MGSAFSSPAPRDSDVEHVISESETMNADAALDTDSNDEFHDATNEQEARAKAKSEDMEEFRKQLSIKREQRKEILMRHRNEKEALEKSLVEERSAKEKLFDNNQQLRELLRANNIEIPENLETASDTLEFTGVINEIRDGFDKLKADNKKLRRDLVEANSSLQSAYSDMADLTAQNTESIKHINALKDVVAVSKTMITLREGQLNELKLKLSEIEKSLSDREANMLSNELKQEYERQLQNIRALRALYEERARIAEITRLGLVRDVAEQKLLLKSEEKKTRELTDKVDILEEKIEKLEDTIENKNIEISVSKDETKGTKAEMAVVNKLFSQVLLGYKTKEDLDKLVHRLEENHGLLTHMAGNENDSEASTALPKLLLEIVSEVEDTENNKSTKQENVSENNDEVLKEGSEPAPPMTSTAEEIVEKLPKVWRVLMELLSHQDVGEDTTDKVTTCYKLVQTKSGPVEVPSVSQTYIRLKDLIVEKLGLVKEVNRMKQLNSHLENRLQEQEKRLCLVTTELGKTWHVVSKLRRQHYQLHTHEKILKYELQQKRKLLNELKEELEYCREKWDEAREKNSQSEKDWKKLRAEFTSRKTKTSSPSFNNSGESGYSDERPSDESSESNDESEYVSEPPIRCKKKMKKSFETIPDSSNDLNCAAEREDPVSDMLDVADLPLDAHDTDGHVVTISGHSASENVHEIDKTCETEDEICEINHDDLITEDTNVLEVLTSEPCTSQIDTVTDPTVIRKQNEKDETLPSLEKNSTTSLEDSIENCPPAQDKNVSDHPSNRLSTLSIDNADSDDSKVQSAEISNIQKDSEQAPSCSILKKNSQTDDDINKSNKSTATEVDFKAIMENIRRQNELLAKKDERLNKLEKGCNDVVHNLTSTLSSGQDLADKLDTLHKDHDISEAPGSFVPDLDKIEDKDVEPSTSTEVDHEARFAARDIRLKRLEEQTKSLVNKVNKTNSKGIKIHYKLQELHNIYGSEGSRAGTPSEDAERSNEEDNDLSENIDEDSNTSNE